jgi:hypothetical protein
LQQTPPAILVCFANELDRTNYYNLKTRNETH